MTTDGPFGEATLVYGREPVRPHNPRDLSLAPVAVEIDENLRRIRDKAPADIALELVLALNCIEELADRADRSRHILEFALKDAKLHGWGASVTDDAARIHLEGGSVTIDLGLSASIIDYIERGAAARPAG